MKFKFSYLMLVVALALAGIAGFFSVIGLSQLFAGAATNVMIMATVLEVGKIVVTTALHKYWKHFNGWLKGYLSIAVFALMVVTSAGIYGLLSNAYQNTANSLEIHNSEVSILESKGSYFEKTIESGKVTSFDFGRTRADSGKRFFKRKWGAVEKPLNYYYLMKPGHVMPRILPENPAFSPAIVLWRHLPRWVHRSVGPLVRVRIPT